MPRTPLSTISRDDRRLPHETKIRFLVDPTRVDPNELLDSAASKERIAVDVPEVAGCGVEDNGRPGLAQGECGYQRGTLEVRRSRFRVRSLQSPDPSGHGAPIADAEGKSHDAQRPSHIDSSAYFLPPTGCTHKCQRPPYRLAATL